MIEIDLDDRLAETATEYGIRDITRSVFYGPDYDRQYTVDSHFKPLSMAITGFIWASNGVGHYSDITR